jgi:hypothetical protein
MDDKKVRLEIAKNIFEEVLDANLHQGEKAARLLIPVTFLTSAATFLFNFFLEKNISVTWGRIDFFPILFLAYLTFTLAGAICIIEIIGPSFEIKGWPGRGKTKKKKQKKVKGPESLLFFKFIMNKEGSEWMDVFLKEKAKNLEGYFEIDALQDRLIHDYVVESYQLAKKTYGKVKKNLLAHALFYVSFCSLLLMAYSGVISYLDMWNWATKALTVFILIIFGLLIVKVIQKYRT